MTTATAQTFRPSTLADAPESIRARAKALAKRLPAAAGRKLRNADKCWTVSRAAREAARDLPAIRWDGSVPVIDTELCEALHSLASAASAAADRATATR
jgi:hypothetical protein